MVDVLNLSMFDLSKAFKCIKITYILSPNSTYNVLETAQIPVICF